jgi:hypothetical protein
MTRCIARKVNAIKLKYQGIHAKKKNAYYLKSKVNEPGKIISKKSTPSLTENELTWKNHQ